MLERIAFWISGLLLLFYVSAWVGAVVTRNVPDGRMIIASILCAGWVGTLVWQSKHVDDKETDVHKFLKKLIANLVFGFLALVLGLKQFLG